jgi:hypothetical protein
MTSAQATGNLVDISAYRKQRYPEYAEGNPGDTMTPEGRIKKKIRDVLDRYKGRIYVYMPVPSGYGKATVDYLICFNGLFVVIEAKKLHGKPTSRQDGVLDDVRAARGVTFVINDDESLDAFALFLESMDNR